MNLSLFIARRYLFSKKSKQAINIISWVSVVSIAVATFALIVVLSAFNGLQHLVESMYDRFEPSVKVSPATGKWLELSEEQLQKIRALDGVIAALPVLEDMALLKHGDKQGPCVLKGVTTDFIVHTGLEESMVEGKAELYEGDIPMALVGYGMANNLSILVSYRDFLNPLKLYVPKFSNSPVMDLSQAFYFKNISVAGVFLINPDIDNKFLIVPIDFTRKLVQEENGITDIEIKTEVNHEVGVKNELKAMLGDDYLVETRFELNSIVYQTNQSEKLATFAIMLFILVIATFNVTGTLAMIVLDKQADIGTMRVLGFESGAIRKIFVTEGLLVNALGALSGLGLGILVCVLQQQFGLVRLEGGIVDYYPVKILFSDVVYIALAVAVVGFIASYLPAKLLIRTDKEH